VLTEENVARYAKALLPTAVLLFLVPIVSVFFQALTTDPGTLQWRFAVAGLFFGNLGTLLLGLGLAGLLAALSGNRTLLRGVGYAALVLAVVTLALLALFALDALQMRRLVVPAVKRQLMLSSASAMVTAVLAALAAGAIGRGALQASRAARALAGGRTKAAPTALVGQTAGAQPPVARPATSVAGEPI
jgi:hypothetical protein